MHMYVALSDGLICMPLKNVYVYNMYDSLADMLHACVQMSMYSYLASLAPHPLIMLYTSRMPALARMGRWGQNNPDAPKTSRYRDWH